MSAIRRRDSLKGSVAGATVAAGLGARRRVAASDQIVVGK